MATTPAAVFALLGGGCPAANSSCYLWNTHPPVPMAAAQKANVAAILVQATITTEADALALLALAGGADDAAPASISCTSASPGVITWTAHGLSINQGFMLVGGTAPTGTSLWTTYFIVSTAFGANSFQFSTSVGGASVNTSSTGTSPTAIAWGAPASPTSQKMVYDYLCSKGQ